MEILFTQTLKLPPSPDIISVTLIFYLIDDNQINIYQVYCGEGMIG